MEWENVVLKEPGISISGNYVNFNSAMRDEIGDVTGMDFFKTNNEGRVILSCKPGNQFLFAKIAKKKNVYRIACKELTNYILSVYDSVRHFKLVFDDGYYILTPQ